MEFRLVSDSGIWFLRAEHDGRVHVAPLVFPTEGTCSVGWDHEPSTEEIADAKREEKILDITDTLKPIGHVVRFDRPKIPA